MTIVAGFKVQDGILLCSDTQYTGAEKVNKQKLFPCEIDGDSYVFALAGHEGNGKMAIDECQEAIGAIGPEQRTLKSIKQALRAAVKPVVDSYVLSRSGELRESLGFELLIGCWIPRGGGHQLFSIGRTGAINRIESYECFGSGAYLGHYLIRPSFSQFMPLEAVMVFATDALRCAKLYDSFCGGPSSFEIIDKSGKHSSVLYDFYSAEQALYRYESQTRNLLYFAAPHNTDESSFEEALGQFVEGIKRIRKEWNDRYELQRLVLRKSNPTISPSPQSTTDGQ